MNFAELVAEVLLITKRADRSDNIASAVRHATLKAHHTDFYPKDLYETSIEWSIPAYIQSLEYKTVIPRWRAFKFIRKYADDLAGDFFTYIQPESLLDDYAIHKENVVYTAGTMLEIRSNTEDQYMLLGCYLHPDITEATFTSWIAEDYPYAIILGAAAIEFKLTGYDEQVATINAAVADEYQLLKHELTGEGY